MGRACPDCRTEMREINLVVQTGDGSRGWLSYCLPRPVEPKRGFFSSLVASEQVDGQMAAMECPRCARVLFFTVPAPAQR